MSVVNVCLPLHFCGRLVQKKDKTLASLISSLHDPVPLPFIVPSFSSTSLPVKDSPFNDCQVQQRGWRNILDSFVDQVDRMLSTILFCHLETGDCEASSLR